MDTPTPNTPPTARDAGQGPTISRREALCRGLGAAGGLVLAGGLPARHPATLVLPPRLRPRVAPARSVIQIWMWGGPSHTDTFDPKPGAGSDYTGPLNKPLATPVDGLQISELLPRLAKLADKYSVVRSMTHGVNGHETAAYTVQTGRPAGGRRVFPSVGAVVSLFKGYGAGYKGLIPPYIVLTQPQGRFSEAGFLGVRYKPFATGGDPSRDPFLVEGVVAPGITPARQHGRRELLHDLDTLHRAMPGDPRLQAFARCEAEAYDLILGDAGKVFELAQEKKEVRDRYGRTRFGQSCLLARRLVERGVPYVTINYNGWDTHKQHFQAMRRLLPELDNGLSSLLADLAERGLLDSTIVWCGGEFGRTPKVQWEPPWNGGRGHWGAVFSTLIAGGGLRGGRVIGASDERGMAVASRPVHPQDLVGAIYERLGIDGGATFPNTDGSVTVLPAAGSGVKSGGRLVELLP